MMTRKLIQASVLALSAAFAMGVAAQTAAPAKVATKAKATAPIRNKVVFQVSDNEPAKWNTTLNNAKNVQEAFGADKVDIEIVAYGPGIHMLKDDALAANGVTEAAKSGIQIVACENTMTAQKLSRADMNPSITYVKAGVVELMKRQREGWAYIRP